MPPAYPFTPLSPAAIGDRIGLRLDWLIRRLRLGPDDADAREARLARRVATEAALARLDQLRGESGVDAAAVAGLRRLMTDAVAPGSLALARDVMAAQRQALIALRDERTISDVTLYEVIHELDHREAALVRAR